MPIPKTPAPEPRLLLRDQVYDAIKSAIVSGELRPGQPLLDDELTSWLGASRTPIREALNRLSHIGLVEILPQRTTRVAPIDLAAFAGMLEVLGVLYSAAIREAVPLLDDAARAEIRRLQALLADPSAAMDRPEQLRVVFAFFTNIYGNEVLSRIPAQYDPHIQRTLTVYAQEVNPVLGEHEIERLLAAALAGDATSAATATQAYFIAIHDGFVSVITERAADQERS